MKRLVFLPGAGGSAEFWKPLADLLPSDWSKTRLSWPGLGNQPHDPNVTSFDDLVRLTERRIGEETVDLVAQSMGGAVALAVTLRNPDRIRRLILCATSGGIDVSDLTREDWRPEYRREFPNASTWITEVRLDFSSRLGSLRQPALVLSGDRDALSPVSVGLRLQSLLPNARLVVVQGGDHGFAQSLPGEIEPHILAHLR